MKNKPFKARTYSFIVPKTLLDKNMYRLLRPLLFLLIFEKIHAQISGCTDPQANNFDPVASLNDGSCQYPQTVFPLKLVAQLPVELPEASGLNVAAAGSGKIWSMNDNGGEDGIVQIHPQSGTAGQKIRLLDAKKTDWEALASDSLQLFVGDFGNNFSGNRTDLGVYRLPLALVDDSPTVEIEAGEWQFLPFKFADQTDFSPKSQLDSIEFDCEAMISFHGKIHLFSKNWKRRTTTHYLLDEASGIAQPLESFDCQGVITDAAVSPDQKLVALLGYNRAAPFDVFVWLLWDFRDGRLFNGNRRRLDLGQYLSVGQAEGIAFSGDRTGFVVNERLAVGGVTLVPQQLKSFDFSQFLTGKVSADEASSAEPRLLVFPNPFSQTVGFQVFENFFSKSKPDFLQVTDELGRQIFLEKFNGNFCQQQLSTANWPAGRYIFQAGFRGKILTFAAVKI